MARFLAFTLLTLFSLVVAFWPEAVLYAVYTSVSPVTELGRIALTLGLVFFGGGISIAMGFLGFMIWISGVGAILKDM